MTCEQSNAGGHDGPWELDYPYCEGGQHPGVGLTGVSNGGLSDRGKLLDDESGRGRDKPRESIGEDGKTAEDRLMARASNEGAALRHKWILSKMDSGGGVGDSVLGCELSLSL